MDKKSFVIYMERLLKIKKAEDNINKAFNEFNPDFSSLRFTPYECLFVDLLQGAMNDVNEWISWWLYEAECGTKFIDGVKDSDDKTIPSETIEDLYDLIIGFN